MPGPGATHDYTVYDPTITHVTIHEGVDAAGHLRYNHMAALAHFDGEFHCAWGANPDTILEGQTNQRLVWSTSADFATWTAPIHFVNDGAVNPIPSDGVQWQPCFVNYNGQELWCVWQNYSPVSSRYGVYLTTLGTGASAQWTNTQIIDRLPIEGYNTVVFPSQNGWITSDGRVLVPATAYVRPAGWSDRLQWNVCLYTDDGGANWGASNPITRPDDYWAQWEPFFYEQADGTLRGFMRNICNLNGTGIYAPWPHWMLTCTGSGVQKGSPLVFEEEPDYAWVETCAVRPFVMRVRGDRFCLLMPDTWDEPGASVGYDDRRSLALCFSQTGANDFVTGIPFNRPNVISTYPQGIEHDNKIYIAYTINSGSVARSIEGAKIDPSPPTDSLCVLPRRKHMLDSNTLRAAPAQVTEDSRTALRFQNSASAGVEVPAIDFEGGQALQFQFDAKATQLQMYGNLVFCSLGDRIPIRLCMPSYRPGKLFAAWADDRWFEVGDFSMDAWHTITLKVWKDCVSVSLDSGSPVAFEQPMTYFNPRLYLGDGYEIDDHTSNDGSTFYVDIDSMSSADIAESAPLVD